MIKLIAFSLVCIHLLNFNFVQAEIINYDELRKIREPGKPTIWYKKFSAKPFTGDVVAYWENGAISNIFPILDGKEHGTY